MNVVESCVEPACMAETKEILHDAETHAWDTNGKEALAIVIHSRVRATLEPRAADVHGDSVKHVNATVSL
jgi:hypothetical protein